ncbi:MAG: two-component regulator propeller domain-containing protein, partial [Bacteroidota bacterium]
MRPFIISLLIYLPSLCLGQAAALRFQSFGIREVLPNQSIQSLYQDERGYLWIGTWDGLSRYDGYGFVNYQRDPFNPNSLAANDVKAIAEDT